MQLKVGDIVLVRSDFTTKGRGYAWTESMEKRAGTLVKITECHEPNSYKVEGAMHYWHERILQKWDVSDNVHNITQVLTTLETIRSTHDQLHNN